MSGGTERLTDERFFTELLGRVRPDLRPAVDAAETRDWREARALFARAMRASLAPDRYLGLPLDLGDNAFTGPSETLEQTAERILTGSRISCGIEHRFPGPIDWLANPTANRYREWTWQLNRHREWVVLGEVYRRTGDERFAQRLVSEFRSWRNQVPLPRDAPCDATEGWRTIEAGIRMNATWPWALHCLLASPHLDDDALIDWCKSVWEHGWRLRHFHSTGNWLIMEMNGLAQIGLLFPVFERAEAWKAYALDRLERELVVQVYPDGFQYELSTHTHQILRRNVARLEAVMARYGTGAPAGWRAKLEPVHAVNLLMMMPDGRLPNLNNGGWHEVAPLMAEPAERYPEREDFRWAATRGAEGRPPDSTSVAFPHAGYVVFRSGWSADAVWALFDGGPFGFRHHHEDKLNLLLHAHGRLLLTEAGTYAFDESPMHRHTLASAGHNTVMVDGGGQNRKRHFLPSEVSTDAPAALHWHFGDTVESAEAVYDEGYGPEAARLGAHHRRLLFLKAVPGLDPCFLVIDRLTPLDGGAHAYQALWHLEASRVRLADRAAHTDDPDAANLSILVSREATLTIAEGRHAPSLQGWTIRQEGGRRVAEAIPTLQVGWHAAQPSRMVTLLWPRTAGADCPVERIEAEDDPADTVVTLLGRECILARIDERRCLGTPAC